jgi:hypothetical protein
MMDANARQRSPAQPQKNRLATMKAPGCGRGPMPRAGQRSFYACSVPGVRAELRYSLVGRSWGVFRQE